MNHPTATTKPRWLGRRIAAPGPYLSLALSQEEFDVLMKRLRVPPTRWLCAGADATAHFMDSPRGLAAVVCLGGWRGRDPVEVAGLLVHEAVHVWQEYAAHIGEKHPGSEQEAYAIQSVAQELMAEFARRTAHETQR